MMKKITFVAFCVVALLAFSGETEAVTCSVTELAECASAFHSPGGPWGVCCSKLKEQQSCFCQYLNNPSLKQYISSPNARKVADACKVAYPKC